MYHSDHRLSQPDRFCSHEEQSSSPTPSQRQAQILQNQLSPQELVFQESLIQEREEEIREIETGIHELSEIFRDLGTLVQEQGGMLGSSPPPRRVYAHLTHSAQTTSSRIYPRSQSTPPAPQKSSALRTSISARPGAGRSA